MIIWGNKVLLQEQGHLLIKKNYAVVTENENIIDIGPYTEMIQKYPTHEVVGDGTQLLMPGFVDSHTHGAGLSFVQRGVPYDILETALLGFECARDISPECNSAMNALRHIKNGCTTIHHNNWLPPLDKTELDTSRAKIESYQKTGIRLGFSCGTRNKNILAYDEEEFQKELPPDICEQTRFLTDYDKDAAVDHYFEVFEELYEKYNGSQTKIFLGPNWVQGSTDSFLCRVKERADQLGKIPIHIHTLQTPVQKAYGLRKYGKSLVEHLDDLGLVDSNLVLGHAVYLNEKDMELLGRKHASITHHPSCNLAVRNGIAPITSMLQHSVNVALGIDEKGINDDEDPVMEMRMMYYLQRVNSFALVNNHAISPETVLKICTQNGSAVCGFGQEIGVIEKGRKADMILINLEEIERNPWSAEDVSFFYLFLHRALGRMVDSVVIGGKLVMKDKKILTIDEESLYRQVREEAAFGQTDKQKSYAKLMEQVKPYYQARYDRWLNEMEWDPYFIMNSKL